MLLCHVVKIVNFFSYCPADLTGKIMLQLVMQHTIWYMLALTAPVRIKANKSCVPFLGHFLGYLPR